MWQTQVNALYTQFRLAARTLLPTPEILAKQKTFFRCEAAMRVFFYTCLFGVKLSFLLFFRRLGAKVRGQRTWWWIVVFVTTATWLSLMGVLDWPCLLRPRGKTRLKIAHFIADRLVAQCYSTHALKFHHRTFIYNCVSDVFTDALSWCCCLSPSLSS